MLASEEAGLDASSLRDLKSVTELALRATTATAQLVLECHLWFMMTEMTDKVSFLDAPFSSGSLFGPAVGRALLNVSRRLKRCNTSSLSTPALLLLPVAPGLRRLRRQLNQRQPPRSPDLLMIGEIEGVHARHDAAPSWSAKDPGPRSPWIRRLRSPPDQPGKKEEGPESCYNQTTPRAASNVPFTTSLNAGCRGKCVFGSS